MCLEYLETSSLNSNFANILKFLHLFVVNLAILESLVILSCDYGESDISIKSSNSGIYDDSHESGNFLETHNSGGFGESSDSGDFGDTDDSVDLGDSSDSGEYGESG